MSLENVLSQLRTKKATSSLNDWLAYRTQILEPLADGKEVDFAEVELFLERVDRTENDLQSDVETLQKRYELRKRLDAAKSAAEDLAAVTDDLAAVDDKFEKAKIAYLAKREPLVESRNRLQNAAAELPILELQLVNTVIDPALKEPLDLIREEIEKAKLEINRLKSEIFDKMYSQRPTINFRVLQLQDRIFALSNRPGFHDLAGAERSRYQSAEREEMLDSLHQELTQALAKREDAQRQLAEERGLLADLEAKQQELFTQALVP